MKSDNRSAINEAKCCLSLAPLIPLAIVVGLFNHLLIRIKDYASHGMEVNQTPANLP